jgi:hypothetical protein
MRYLLIPSVAALMLLAACNSAESNNEYVASADSTSFSEDASQLTSGSRKITRQADIQCRVRNVQDATLALETTVTKLGGLVAQSTISNQSVQEKLLSYKPDSLRQVTSYIPVASLVLRVPQYHLDSLLHLLPQMAEFTEYRGLRQDDKTLAYLANALKNEALRPARQKSKIADTGINTVESVDRRIENLQILDDVHYATVTIELAQPALVYTTVIVNTDYIASEPFGTQLGDSLHTGWKFLQNLFVALVAVWPLGLALALGWTWYKIWRKKLGRA